MIKTVILFFGIIIGIFFVVFIMQNTIVVDVVLLGQTFSMSRALMLIIVLVTGIILGLIIKSLISWRIRNKPHE